jgi:Neuraminidase (sialidase)
MQHYDVIREAGTYAAFPVLDQLPDGRLAVGALVNTYRDHYGFGVWRVLISRDQGETWQPTDDPRVPLTWPGSSPRERYDRLARILPTGAYVAAGAVGPRDWPAERRTDAERADLAVYAHPSGDPTRIAAASSTIFAQRSDDGGLTWSRQDWRVPGLRDLVSFPRGAVLTDGTLLLPAYATTTSRANQLFVLHSNDAGRSWRLAPLPGGVGDEFAVVEASPGGVLAHIRHGRMQPLLESWSDDGGRTWSWPMETPIWGFPPHLLRLRNGHLLCTYGHRREPLGIQAVFSEDGGRSWDLTSRVILRDEGESQDLGYPQSTELADGSIFTAYYLTRGGLTYVAATRWS